MTQPMVFSTANPWNMHTKLLPKLPSLFTLLVVLALLQSNLIKSSNAQLQYKRQRTDNVVAEMQVVCHSDAIVLKVNTNTPFNGMLYAKDAPASNNCVTQFNSATNMTFRLPLKSCGTMSAEVDDGIEYFNTIVVQPHMRLMTNQGKGYHVRCKYQTRERTIANTHFNVSAAFLMQNGPQTPATPLLATASMPSCTMKIYRSGGHDDVAETVKIGDKLIMVIEIDQQDMYGMKITNCVVRDGLNKAAQELINELGCPLDENIMPKFEYANNYTRAAVSFPAHKFPHTSSVYYQCNVRLCISNNGGCESADCSANSSSSSSSSSALGGPPRNKRFVVPAAHHELGQQQEAEDGDSPPAPLPTASGLKSSRHETYDDPLPAAQQSAGAMSFDVYSGLYVNDIDVGESGSSDPNGASRVLWTATRGASEQPSAARGAECPNCVTPTRAGLIALLASLVSVGLFMMFACQVGLFALGPHASGDQQVPAPVGERSSPANRAARGYQPRQPPNVAAVATTMPYYLHESQHQQHRRPNNKHLGMGIIN